MWGFLILFIYFAAPGLSCSLWDFFFFFNPKRVYWDGFPFILIQGTFSAASV